MTGQHNENVLSKKLLWIANRDNLKEFMVSFVWWWWCKRFTYLVTSQGEQENVSNSPTRALKGRLAGRSFSHFHLDFTSIKTVCHSLYGSALRIYIPLPDTDIQALRWPTVATEERHIFDVRRRRGLSFQWSDSTELSSINILYHGRPVKRCYLEGNKWYTRRGKYLMGHRRLALLCLLHEADAGLTLILHDSSGLQQMNFESFYCV